MSNGGDVSQPGSREPLHYDAVLVVEGRDMFGFFLALLRELGLEKRIEVRNGGGVPDLYDFLAVLPNVSNFDKVASLGVVCDAEADPVAAFNDLCTALRRAGLSVPAAVLQPTSSPPAPRTTVALLPDAGTPGMLETLLWRTLAGDPLTPCVEQYLDCVRKLTGQPLAYEDKSRVHTYIAGRDQPWLLVGQAARAKYFPWASTAFDEIKRFVQSLVSAAPSAMTPTPP
jgi:hypothetical protein